MSKPLARALKQTRPFASPEEEVVLALQHTAARIIEPWASYLKATARLTVAQYNVLRILRGAHPARLACSEVASRLVARDPDITRLIDRLADRGLVDRERDGKDRRVVHLGITRAGLSVLADLDPAVEQFPRQVLAPLGAKRLGHLGNLLQDVLGSLGSFEPEPRK